MKLIEGHPFERKELRGKKGKTANSLVYFNRRRKGRDRKETI